MERAAETVECGELAMPIYPLSSLWCLISGFASEHAAKLRSKHMDDAILLFVVLDEICLGSTVSISPSLGMEPAYRFLDKARGEIHRK